MKLNEIKEAIKFNCGCEYCGKTKMEWTFNQTLNAVKEEIQLLKKQMAINPREEQIFDIILENIDSPQEHTKPFRCNDASGSTLLESQDLPSAYRRLDSGEQGTKIPADNVKNQKSYFEERSMIWENYMGLLGIAFMGLGILCLFSLILIVAGGA